MSNLKKYLKSEENGYIQLNPEIEAKAKEITAGAKTDAGKAQKIYEYVRDIDYFISPSMPAPYLINRTAMDCGSKHTLQAALLRASGIPARINLMECPLPALAKTIEHIRLPKAARLITGTLINTIGQDINYGTHYATDVYYDGKWHFQDATAPPSLCNYFTGDKKKECLSKKNVSALLGCHKIGHTMDLPSNGVILSSLTKMALDYMDLFGMGIDEDIIKEANSGKKIDAKSL